MAFIGRVFESAVLVSGCHRPWDGGMAVTTQPLPFKGFAAMSAPGRGLSAPLEARRSRNQTSLEERAA